jgi:hypothetical protein
LGERLLCKQEVVGSIPSGSTRRIVRPAEQQAIEQQARQAAIILVRGKNSSVPVTAPQRAGRARGVRRMFLLDTI